MHTAVKIVMIQNLTPIIAVLTFVLPVLIFIMLLPAIHELKKPKDERPRMIMDDTPVAEIQIMHMAHIVNIESEQKFDATVTQQLAKIMAVLPNLEA
jgi:hypothetical protein